jgi:uncharacterized tellurite resistance protein B-like protein
MFRSIKSFIADIAGDAASRPSAGESSLAITALLVRVATVNREMTEARGMMLHAIVKSRFELDDRTTARLVKESAAVVSAAIDLYRFTRQLNEVLDQEGRRRVVQMMWQIVYANGVADEFETNIIWRTADLLGVSTRQRVELRQGVLAGAPALARNLFRNINSPSSAA